MIKKEKVAFVEGLSKDLKKYKSVGILPIEALPDRLVQKVRNQLKPDTKIVVARKSLLIRALSDPKHKELAKYISGNVALILSNKSPFEISKIVGSNRLRLVAKPNQVSPEDIHIEAGETAIAPGQAVTDLKAAGIDVKIDKGKVVISKPKILVPKGQKISLQVAKALKMLDILPFEARAKVSAITYENLLYDETVLGMNQEVALANIARNFSEAHALSIAIGIPTPYNIREMISKAFMGSLSVGLEAKIPEGEVAEKLAALASIEASALNALVKKEE